MSPRSHQPRKPAPRRTILEDTSALRTRSRRLRQAHSEALAKIEAEMAQAEDEWLELEMRREAVEG